MDLLKEELQGPRARECTSDDNALMVVTRGQAQREKREEEGRQDRQTKSGAKMKPLENLNASAIKEPEKVESTVEEAKGESWIQDFDEELFTGGHERSRLTRSEKRVGRQRYRRQVLGQDLETPPEMTKHALDISMGELKILQEADTTLEMVRRAADEHPSHSGMGFFRRDGLVYRRWTPDPEVMAVEQLVLPLQCRGTVLTLAHSIPLAGHLGKDKTSRRILQRFYWPTVYKDVARFCRSCATCQKATHYKPRRVPLIPLPIISEPFERMAMDIIGPLPRSHSGKRYVLVVCDYATRYPEAIPMKSIDAECVAEELVTLFSRVGVPKEILTDQGTNFTSQLLMEVYRLLQVHLIRTTPYHPQTDGLVERFNRTLKSMLRKCANEGKDWDKLIPYLLFAYREVPQASTGFSPFELLYGRSVRGPLDILRESWEAGKKSGESIVSHVLSIREKMEQMFDLVDQNLREAQNRQKQWYDQNSSVRGFQPDDQVLVLLPTSTNKLLAQCHTEL